MKRLIKKVFVFFITLSTATAAINFMYGKFYKVDPCTNKFFTIPETVQICNFGSSHGMYGFCYEDLEDDYNCFNFGLLDQFLSYDYRLFQYYGNHIAEGGVVFIPVSYFSLFGTEENGRGDFLSKNKRYYSILPAALIKEYDWKTGLYVRYFPALASSTNDLIDNLLGTDDIEIGWRRVATDIDVGEYAAKRFDGFAGNKEIYYDDGGNRIENREEIDALYALIRGCQERGAIPVLITTPFLHEYADLIKENAEDYCDHFYSIVDRVVKDTGAEYYDYMFDERFVNEYSWFIDADHLNEEGARNFTDILMREIVYAKGYLDK